MKKCSKCSELKSLDSFQKMASCYDGLYPSCKVCKNEKDKAIRRTIRGVVTELYKKQRWSSKKRQHNMPEYSKEEFRKWLYSQPLFFKLSIVLTTPSIGVLYSATTLKRVSSNSR